jgi:cell division protein FtsQ
VSAASAETVTLTLADGRTVVWGGPERTGDKARILTALLRENAMTFDVSSPDVVTVK